MYNISKYILIGLLVMLFTATQGLSGENVKLAQTGFQFLSVSSDARATAMGNAVNSLEMGASSLFYNPAGLANMQHTVDVSLSKNEWIADINHNTLAVAVRPFSGRFGVLGITAQSVDYGDLLGTVVANNAKGYEDTGTFSPAATAIGLGYARALNDRFSVGGQVRYTRQDLGSAIIPLTDSTTTTDDNVLSPFAFDFGTFYKTGFKSLVFGMSVRNFSKEIKYEEEGFQLPLVFTMGISMDIMDFFEPSFEQSLVLAVDATHYRSHPEQVLVGLDYKVLNLLSLRGGYVFGNDDNGMSFGVGVSQFGVVFDYAYTPFNSFDSVQRMTLRLSL